MLPRPEKEVHGLCERLFSPPTPYGSPLLILRGCCFHYSCLPPSRRLSLRSAGSALRGCHPQMEDSGTRQDDSTFFFSGHRRSPPRLALLFLRSTRFQICPVWLLKYVSCVFAHEGHHDTPPFNLDILYSKYIHTTLRKQRRSSARPSWALIQTA
ncbi:hypothetical protein BO82DRAFT_143899 [Aspergillus uvarum CBS 121591]|uniref:Uncharacterized protein n=1 Tax=Aspergillus uvarum CBS 121591 TaxID=1448315 RepID=A0A319DCX6_9EURO|nr:hypothetical protein BO82DRAFT_143899 [Aspergillus uvarum CBS 121591]PYH85978.1 hypothetical protein BO82DRAFT_143899 [Aspergillus uvarum CBS 121591]